MQKTEIKLTRRLRTVRSFVSSALQPDLKRLDLPPQGVLLQLFDGVLA
jgi:hypothetical protein